MNDESNIQKKSWKRRLFEAVYALVAHAIFAALILVGILASYLMFNEWRAGKAHIGEALAFGVFGLVMTMTGIGFFYFGYIGAPRYLNRLRRIRTKYRDQPWLVRPEWRGRRVVYAANKFTAQFMWIWCFVWWAILTLIW